MALYIKTIFLVRLLCLLNKRYIPIILLYLQIFFYSIKIYNKILILALCSSNSTMWKTDDERIATLSFVYLDKNKNKSWDRREWKNFRDLVTSAR